MESLDFKISIQMVSTPPNILQLLGQIFTIMITSFELHGIHQNQQKQHLHKNCKSTLKIKFFFNLGSDLEDQRGIKVEGMKRRLKELSQLDQHFLHQLLQNKEGFQHQSRKTNLLQLVDSIFLVVLPEMVIKRL